MKTIIRLCIFCFLALIVTCATPKQKFDKGDYHAAYFAALKVLKTGKKASNGDVDILLRSLDKIYSEEQQSITAYESSNDLSDIEKAYDLNQKILEKIEAANPYLSDKFNFNYQQTLEKEKSLGTILVDEYLLFGQEDLNTSIDSGDKMLAQEAYRSFQKALKYGAPAYELDSLIQLCYDYGTMIFYIEADAPFNLSLNWEIDRLFEDVESYQDGFTRVIYERIAENIDCIIQVRFNSLSFFNTQNSRIQTFSQNIVTGYQTVADTSGTTRQEEIREQVEGTVRTVESIRSGEWEANIFIKANNNNCQLSEATFIANTESVVTNYELNGDRRAIPLEYTNPPSNNTVFSDKQMSINLIEAIYLQFLNYYFR